jgi:hypothetical protein
MDIRFRITEQDLVRTECPETNPESVAVNRRCSGMEGAEDLGESIFRNSRRLGMSSTCGVAAPDLKIVWPDSSSPRSTG